MSEEDKVSPATRGDVRRIEEKLDKVLVGLHGDGSDENVGLFSRVRDLERFIGSIKANIRGLWSGGFTVATFVGGNFLWRWITGSDR